MLAILSALIPTFGLILVGFALRHWRFLPDAFWPGAEKLTYFITFPALLFANTAKADLGSLPVTGIAIVILGTAFAKAALTIMAKPALRVSDAAFTSVFQGAIRPNTYIGLAIAAALLGERGLTVTALCIALIVPTVNILSVLACSHWGDNNRKAGLIPVLRDVMCNPLLMACVLGMIANASGLGLPPIAGPFLEVLGRAALPVGLLAVGAGIDLQAAHRAGGPVAASTLGKLVLSPAIAIGLSLLLNMPSLDMAALALYAGLPCSASAYVLARLMGGDAKMMASIITVQTLVAIATMPILAILLHAA
ncbi:AEC family transporter [uncultured Thalassospira sp.]|uniref:AEC family transporter n=1 Tax=uncultured Thalassospira sp. TaxID=404382 RepID=UPI0030D7182F|tara:strand:+ start:3355 stop:4278 length:924 start_codon:yes stop_codon:yes gene_type:complete